MGEEERDWDVGEELGGGDQGWDWGADHVDGGCWTQQLHGPRWAQWPIETGRLAVAAPEAAQAPVGCLAVAAVRMAHGTVVQGHWGRSGSTLRRLPFLPHTLLGLPCRPQTHHEEDGHCPAADPHPG